jgi:hypothetical protein
MGCQESGGGREYAKHFDRTTVYTGTGLSPVVKQAQRQKAADQAARCREQGRKFLHLHRDTFLLNV